MDFLSSGTTSNNNQSNSYTLRQRQIWGKAETTGGFAMSGGQMWSLVAEDGTSTNNRTEKLPNAIDPQYTVGFSLDAPAGDPHSAALGRCQDRRFYRGVVSRAGADHRLHRGLGHLGRGSNQLLLRGSRDRVADSTTRTAGPTPTTLPRT